MQGQMLTRAENEELSSCFQDFRNYESDNFDAPIDPVTYITPSGETCLHVAALRGNLRAAELLLKAGSNPNALGDMSCTPLHYAVRRKFEDIEKLLVKFGADSSLQDEFGKRPFDYRT